MEEDEEAAHSVQDKEMMMLKRMGHPLTLQKTHNRMATILYIEVVCSVCKCVVICKWF